MGINTVNINDIEETLAILKMIQETIFIEGKENEEKDNQIRIFLKDRMRPVERILKDLLGFMKEITFEEAIKSKKRR